MIKNLELSNKWKEIKGAVRNVWGDIRDEELDLTKGDLNSICELVKEKYDESEISIQAKMQNLINSFDNDTDDTDYFTTSYERSPVLEEAERDAYHSSHNQRS